MADHAFQNYGKRSSTGALPPWWTADTVAVVTGANRGIGFEIVRKLALEGMTVVLTARDEGRGRKATGDLHAANLKNVVFHQLDVADPDSVTEFAKWLKETYNGLDVLVNNAAICAQSHTYDKALEGMNTNYFGPMNLTEKLLPLFKESATKACIINMSSLGGFLANVKDKKIQQALSDPNTFDQAFLNSIAQSYISACHSNSEDVHQYGASCYIVSKVLLNAYTRLLAKAFPTLSVHCVHPRLVDTRLLEEYIEAMTPKGFQEQIANGFLGREGIVGVHEGADTVVWLVLYRPSEEKSGLFWYRQAVLSFYYWE